MIRWDVVAKAHELVAKLNTCTPEKVRMNIIEKVLSLEPR